MAVILNQVYKGRLPQTGLRGDAVKKTIMIKK